MSLCNAFVTDVPMVFNYWIILNLRHCINIMTCLKQHYFLKAN